jgi:hypothetical protein
MSVMSLVKSPEKFPMACRGMEVRGAIDERGETISMEVSGV